MKSRSILRSSLAVLTAAVLLAAVSPPSAPAAARAAAAVQAQEIRGLTLQERQKLVGKSAAIRGFYSNKSVPLIVDDIERMSVRKPLPPGSYILIAGTLPAGLRHGDRLEARGAIARPTAADPAQFRGEPTILKLSSAADAVRVIAPSALKMIPAADEETTKRIATASAKFKTEDRPGAIHVPRHYAVLINGGQNAANNRVSFYNDLVVSYNLMIGRGCSPDDITVINADGGGAPPGSTPCGRVPVHYAATVKNLRTVFAGLAGKITSVDTLYVMITDHGGEGLVCLWREDISWRDFGALINGIRRCAQMVIAIDICHAGGLVSQVMGERRVVIAACDSGALAMDSSRGDCGGMTFALISALTGMEPTGGTVNADENSDGRISLAEAFNYVRSHVETRHPQRAHYNDDAAMPDATGILPQGTDGIWGAGRYL